MSIRNLNRLFQPRCVAVVGASPKVGSIGYTVLDNLRCQGFSGPICPVNPKYSQLHGVDCYHHIADLPQGIDLAIVCTPAESVPQIVDECGQAGVSTLIIISAGFREIGPAGLQLELEIGRAASKYSGLRIMGPNCLGVLSPHFGLNASFAKHLPKGGRTAFISQSGALCTAILDLAIDEGMGFSLVASLGNALDVDVGDMIDYLATDPHTESIVLYIESINDARKFISAARAFTGTKPIVAYKSGRFAASAAAAASHTGAMVGEDCVYDAAFARAGIVRVTDMSELFSSAEVLARGRLPKGPRLAIVSNAGGPGIMATDALMSRQGILTTLSPETLAKLNVQLPLAWSHQNPIDILGDAPPARFGSVASCVLADDSVDALIVLLTPQAMTDPTESAEALIVASRSSTKPVLAVWMGGASVRDGITRLNQSGIPTFQTPEQAVAAFESLVVCSHRREVLRETPRLRSIGFSRTPDLRAAATQGKSGLMNEIDSKDVLAAYDIPVNPSLFAGNAQEAVQIAKTFSGPVALKIVSPDISHKSTVGGVVLNVQGDVPVETAFDRILSSAKAARPDAQLDGVSVQPMIVDPNAVELIVGVKRDPTFGAVLMLGSGGTMAELIQDKVVELPPLNERMARRMIESMRTWPLLDGYRGGRRANIEQLIDIMIRFSYLVAERPEIIELDMNPLVVTPTEVVALDARIVLDSHSPVDELRPFRHLAIRPYPTELTRHLVLGDGPDIALRPICPEDEPSWIRLLSGCSASTIHGRFGGLIQNFDHEFASRYCYIDYDRELAIVAEIELDGDKQLIGVGRLVTNADRDRASLSLLVSDAWQHRGLGSHVADFCLEIAQEWHVADLVAETTADNFPAREIFQRRGFALEAGDDGIVIMRRHLSVGGAQS